jgi:hypothetical protein
MKRFYLAFTGIMLAPLLVFDLMFDDKQDMFMQLNYKIMAGSMLIFLIWGIGFYLLNKKYMVIPR